MNSETDFFETIRDIAGLSVVHSDFVVVSGERSGRSVYEPLTSLLHRVRAAVGVEVLFVTQFLDETPAVRQRGPGESSWYGASWSGAGIVPEPQPAFDGKIPPVCP